MAISDLFPLFRPLSFIFTIYFQLSLVILRHSFKKFFLLLYLKIFFNLTLMMFKRWAKRLVFGVNAKTYTQQQFFMLNFNLIFNLQIMVLIWRVISFFCRKRTSFNKHVFKFTALSKVDELNLATVMENVQFGEWMFLSYLASNLSPLNFNYYLSKLAESFERDYYPNEPAPKVPENTILISV